MRTAHTCVTGRTCKWTCGSSPSGLQSLTRYIIMNAIVAEIAATINASSTLGIFFFMYLFLYTVILWLIATNAAPSTPPEKNILWVRWDQEKVVRCYECLVWESCIKIDKLMRTSCRNQGSHTFEKNILHTLSMPFQYLNLKSSMPLLLFIFRNS